MSGPESEVRRSERNKDRINYKDIAEGMERKRTRSRSSKEKKRRTN